MLSCKSNLPAKGLLSFYLATTFRKFFDFYRNFLLLQKGESQFTSFYRSFIWVTSFQTAHRTWRTWRNVGGKKLRKCTISWIFAFSLLHFHFLCENMLDYSVVPPWKLFRAPLMRRKLLRRNPKLVASENKLA